MNIFLAIFLLLSVGIALTIYIGSAEQILNRMLYDMPIKKWEKVVYFPPIILALVTFFLANITVRILVFLHLIPDPNKK